VHDAEHVGLGDGLARLQDVLHGILDGQRPLVRHDPREVAALQVLHDHVGRARFERPHVDDAGNVLALDLHRGAGLARETGDRLGVLEGIRNQELDGHPLVELQVRGGNHHAHPAHPEDLLDAVLAGQNLPGLDGRRVHRRPSSTALLTNRSTLATLRTLS
jgi:hypothetical protein